MSFLCSLCNNTFNDEGSLKIHHNYSHNSQPTESDAECNFVENNQHFQQVFIKSERVDSIPSTMTAISSGACEGPDFYTANVQRHYNLSTTSIPTHNNYEDYHEHQCASAASQGNSFDFTSERYYPYYKPHFQTEHHHSHIPLSSLRCDECNLLCPSQEILTHHLNIAHGINPGTIFDRAKVLDLESQKVHVYQPPVEGTRKQDLWIDNKKFHRQQVQLLQNSISSPSDTSNGGGETPSHSPDFGNVSTTTNDAQDMPDRPPYYDSTTPVQISSTDHSTARNSSKSRSSSTSKASSGNDWKSNEARRPKTYNCSTCNKWFTSSGHLKRHYSTTLHKNAVKQSGAAHPATLTVSVHHHPHKDQPYSIPPTSKSRLHRDPVTPDLEGNSHYNNCQYVTRPPKPQQQSQIKQELNSSYNISDFPQIPNLVTGSFELSGDLRQHPSSQPLHPQPPVPSEPVSYPSFGNYQPHPGPVEFSQPAMSATVYPNFKSPHVSTTNQVITLSSNFGKLVDDENAKLPSFSCIQKNMMWNSDASFLNLDDKCDVGGTKYSSSNMEVKPECQVEEAALQPQPEPQQIEDTRVSSSTERVAPISPIESTKMIFSCERCHKFFNKACYLTQHNKSFHSGFKPFKCERCGKRFIDNAQYRTHSDKHAGDKPYKCDICPKAFNHKTDLRRHACLHTNMRPHNCDICSKGFIRKDHMLKHRDTHQNRRSVLKKTRVKKMKREMPDETEVAY